MASADGVTAPGVGAERLAQALAQGQYDVVERAFGKVWARAAPAGVVPRRP